MSTGAEGTARLWLGGFCFSRSSQSFAQFFEWISIEAVPNSRPLSGNYHMWHITAFGRTNGFSFGTGLNAGGEDLQGAGLLDDLANIF